MSKSDSKHFFRGKQSNKSKSHFQQSQIERWQLSPLAHVSYVPPIENEREEMQNSPTVDCRKFSSHTNFRPSPSTTKIKKTKYFVCKKLSVYVIPFDAGFFLKRRHTRLCQISSYRVTILSMNVAKISKSLRVIAIILTYLCTCTKFRLVPIFVEWSNGRK